MSRTATENRGTVVSVRGSVIDARFPNRLPLIDHLLEIGEDRRIVTEVSAHLLSAVDLGKSVSRVGDRRNWRAIAG